MIQSMALQARRHTVGPAQGTLEVRTYREGMVQKVGHDLVIGVGDWHAVVQAAEDGSVSSVELEADSRSLQVRQGVGGVKPLTDKDRAEIRKNIDEKILRRQPITFRSTAVEGDAGKLIVSGELTLVGTSRPVTFDLETKDERHVTGTLPITQTDWGIKPYRGLMGALKVRDAVEIIIDVQLLFD
jgi:polyisoprenoid-binding protein YceI